jgi:CheY-like chemotaxis protein
MENLLHDLLSFSHLIHQEITPTHVADLSAALSQALSMLAPRIEEAGAKITYNGLPTVCGEQGQLSQVFQNLLSNALKYRKANEQVHIEISAKRDPKGWVIGVIDNGIGFEQKHADQIFGLFKRLYRDEYAGTGVGLAICKRIIERNGGTIWAESEPGKGSAFFLQFWERTSMMRINVLLAEDNEADIFLVEEALRTHQLEYALQVVSDGDEANQCLEERARKVPINCPDIFLMDLNLPRGDGFKLLDEFRRLCGHEVPVVIITSSQAPADIARAAELGANRYFRKPSELDEFLQLGELVKDLVTRKP